MASVKTRQIYIHVGAHKTASAMIRRTLAGMRDDLRAHDMRLIRRDEINAAPYFKHIQKIKRGKISWEAEPADQVSDSLQGVLDGPESRVLLTSEDLFSRLEPGSFFRRTADVLRFLQRHWRDCEIRIALYVRSQETFVTSCYAQTISMGKSLSFDQFTGRTVPRNLDWNRVCEEIAAVIGQKNIFVRPYESLHQDGPVRYFAEFLEFLAVDPELAHRVESVAESGARSNRGLSAPALELARCGNRILEREDRVRLRKFLQNSMSTSSHPKPTFWADAQRDELARLYGPANEALFRTFMPGIDPLGFGYPGLRAIEAPQALDQPVLKAS